MLFQALLTLLLQLHLAAAAPITAQGNEVGFGAGGGVIGFVVLILDIICVGMPIPPSILHHLPYTYPTNTLHRKQANGVIFNVAWLRYPVYRGGRIWRFCG